MARGGGGGGGWGGFPNLVKMLFFINFNTTLASLVRVEIDLIHLDT